LLQKPDVSSANLEPALIVARIQQNRLSLETPIRIAGLAPKQQYVTGVAMAHDGSLFAVDINTDRVYRLAPQTFTVEGIAGSEYGAYRTALSPDGNVLAVSNWGDESVSLFAASNLKSIARIRTGSHPNDLCFAPDGRLFVANSGSNTVSVIVRNQVIETIKTSLNPTDPVGSTPDAVAVDPTGRWLYVANADNNDVAVIDIERRGHSEVEGFIPTGWYPSALAVSSDGKRLLVGFAKGLGSRANFPAIGGAPHAPLDSRNPYDFVGDTLNGYVSVIEVPDERTLRQMTQMVIHNVPPVQPPQDAAHAALIQKSVFPVIRHVLYVIRENRTYDQVLGDVRDANGDPALTLFGEKVTPNAHRIAKEWTLFDNLFVNGEVSENGHQWSDAAYATDFTSQAWLQSYSGRPEPKAAQSELGADERLRSSPAGYLWDNCERHGLSFRTYGEFAYFHSGPDEGPRFVAKGLEGHASVAWLKLASAGWTDVTRGRDPDLAQLFIKEMHDAERTGVWPRFMVMSLGEDHTHALRPGHYTPAAMVASNDQALGAIVEAVSHSRFWPDTAIFIIEDDAQDGPDHVDCRRTVGLVVSPYIKRHIVDGTMYTTASMIHTMELILGLPTMTQFDRAATPMYNAFTAKPDYTTYNNSPAKTDLFAKNPAEGPAAEASLRLDLSGYDRADPGEMNRILRYAMKPAVPMPVPVRTTFFNKEWEVRSTNGLLSAK
jgi:YVTN family beta-propeller protein